jgi:Bacteriocin-protection, YdeI or OmpD-Associated/Domain of unknown function (DUF1905)
MARNDTRSRFDATLLRPLSAGDDKAWVFVVLPKDASAKLPRRGRTTVEGTMNGRCFQATLDPDGRLSHWLRIDEDLLQAAGAKAGEVATFEIAASEREPEPEIPSDLREALAASPEARTTWDDTTTIARLDWIHWIASAKQSRTRAKRIRDACDMLASGKRKVCCFDNSGYYSKALSAPEAAE